MITKKAHAKLNLSLDVTGKRENAYHDIKTLMVMTDLYDEMKFSKSDKVEIEKNIPLAAGLAGGTSNGAGTFYALNELYDLKIPKKDLIKLSSSLGADFTYMMTGGSKLASGIGEILEEVKPIELENVLIVNPGYGVSTKEVYEKIKIDDRRIDSVSYTHLRAHET